MCYSSYAALKWKRSVQQPKVGTVNAVLESKLDCGSVLFVKGNPSVCVVIHRSEFLFVTVLWSFRLLHFNELLDHPG